MRSALRPGLPILTLLAACVADPVDTLSASQQPGAPIHYVRFPDGSPWLFVSDHRLATLPFMPAPEAGALKTFDLP